MDVIALVLSGLSLAVAGLGTLLSNLRATEALNESRKAALGALWSDLQQAVQRFIGFDPSLVDVGERLVNLRIAMISLVDELDGWEGLDRWLEAERALGAVVGRQVMDRSSRGTTIDQRMANLDPYQRWADTLGKNIRMFRKQGYDAAEVKRLAEHAEKLAREVYATNGWAPPPPAGRGVGPLGG